MCKATSGRVYLVDTKWQGWPHKVNWWRWPLALTKLKTPLSSRQSPVLPVLQSSSMRSPHLDKRKGTHFFWNRTIGSFSRSLMSSCAPFSLTAGCLRHKSQPTCEKKKPGVGREKERVNKTDILKSPLLSGSKRVTEPAVKEHSGFLDQERHEYWGGLCPDCLPLVALCGSASVSLYLWCTRWSRLHS